MEKLDVIFITIATTKRRQNEARPSMKSRVSMRIIERPEHLGYWLETLS